LLALTDFLLQKHAVKGVPPPPLTPNLQKALLTYRWPGNVRELENACERIVQTCSCGTVRIGCVAAGVLFGAVDPSPAPLAAEIAVADAPSISLDDRLREVESNLITWALKASDGNKSKAAELLSIKRSTLGDRIARCGLQEPASPTLDEAHPSLVDALSPMVAIM
jgi:sigma-54 dependent transcriptional regulator, flagellar regulatory protein